MNKMKNKILMIIIALLILGSIYTVTNYNKSKALGNTIQKSNTANNANNLSNSNISSNSSTSPFNKKTSSIPALNFTLKDLDGKEVSLKDLKGKKVFLNFWATWCPPCRGEMPEIEKIYEESKNSDLVIIAVNIGEDRDTVKAFMDKNNYKFKVLLDSNNDIATNYQISAIPTSFFIDKDGKIVNKNVGAMNYADMMANIKALDN